MKNNVGLRYSLLIVLFVVCCASDIAPRHLHYGLNKRILFNISLQLQYFCVSFRFYPAGRHAVVVIKGNCLRCACLTCYSAVQLNWTLANWVKAHLMSSWKELVRNRRENIGLLCIFTLVWVLQLCKLNYFLQLFLWGHQVSGFNCEVQ